jgi:hypothetical protein
VSVGLPRGGALREFVIGLRGERQGGKADERKNRDDFQHANILCGKRLVRMT